MKINKTKTSLIMAEKGLNQQGLADLVPMSRGNLSTLLNGKSCQAITVLKIAKALKVDVTEILED